MTEERIVPVKSWLRPTTYRVLLEQAHARGLADVGDLLARVAEQLVTPPASSGKRAGTATPADLERRRAERHAAFAADTTDPRHGTLNGYSNLRCRCERCREAGRTYQAEKRPR